MKKSRLTMCFTLIFCFMLFLSIISLTINQKVYASTTLNEAQTNTNENLLVKEQSTLGVDIRSGYSDSVVLLDNTITVTAPTGTDARVGNLLTNKFIAMEEVNVNGVATNISSLSAYYKAEMTFSGYENDYSTFGIIIAKTQITNGTRYHCITLEQNRGFIHYYTFDVANGGGCNNENDDCPYSSSNIGFVANEKATLEVIKGGSSYRIFVNGTEYCSQVIENSIPCFGPMIQKDLFSSGKSGKVYIKYQFKDFREIKNTLQLCMEVSGAKAIYVNGVMPKILDNEWFIDKSIKVFSLENVPIKTDNEIVVEYYIPEFNSDITGKFETVRNLFHYPIEPECIYIRGEFGVSFNGDYVDKTEYISCSGDFCLDSIKVIEDISNITPSSLWFYRGSLFVDYEFYGDDYTCLTVEDISSNGVLLTINGIEKFVFTKGQKIILNGLLNPGINKIRAEYLGTNRNTLGAFHHYAGEPKMTGRNTFEGIKGFEDFVNHDAKDITFTEKYNFIKFGAGKIKLFKL